LVQSRVQCMRCVCAVLYCTACGPQNHTTQYKTQETHFVLCGVCVHAVCDKGCKPIPAPSVLAEHIKPKQH